MSDDKVIATGKPVPASRVPMVRVSALIYAQHVTATLVQAERVKMTEFAYASEADKQDAILVIEMLGQVAAMLTSSNLQLASRGNRIVVPGARMPRAT